MTRARVEEGTRLARARARREAEWQDLSIARTRPALDAVSHRIGETSDTVAHGLVPHVFGDTKPSDPERHAAFAAHLDRLIERAFADPAPDPDPLRSFEPEDPEDFARRDTATDTETSPLDAACIACQGRCCFGAAHENAFLTDRSLAYARHRRPQAGPEDLRAAYFDRLPLDSIPNSCLYHGPQGCTLDRELRSDVCNHFECGPRFRLGEAHAATGGGPLIAIGLVADHHESPQADIRGLRVVSHGPDGFRIHDDLKLPALAKDRE